MKFESIPTVDAESTILAHTLRLPNLVISKGRRLTSGDLVKFGAVGVDRISVARLEPGDVLENDAARRAARNLAGPGIVATKAHTGRVNLCASTSGIAVFDPQRVSALNHIDEAITIATVPLHDVVEPRQIVATIKVNPYAVSETVVAAWEEAATTLRIAAFRSYAASLIQTLAPGLKDSVLEKTVLATKDRLESLGSALSASLQTPHSAPALSMAIRTRIEAGDELILVCGASSIVDRRDVIPSAIVAAGGRIECFGMPVEPGNLLLLGVVGDVPVIGMPGCARSRKLNGLDYVLRLMAAGFRVGREQIMAMGVGGLLRDVPWRPAPRSSDAGAANASPEAGTMAPRIAAVVLAAGRSSRMGSNKLMLALDGKPILCHVVDTIRSSGVSSIIVVLGHEAAEVHALLGETGIKFVFNDHYQHGISTSLKKGISALPQDIDGALIFLGDMPDINVELVDRMIEAFNPREMRGIIVPKREGRRGHPVLWGREFFSVLLERMSGDAGARHLIGQNAKWVAEIDVDHDGIFTDLDTPEEFALRLQRTNGAER